MRAVKLIFISHCGITFCDGSLLKRASSCEGFGIFVGAIKRVSLPTGGFSGVVALKLTLGLKLIECGG